MDLKLYEEFEEGCMACRACPLHRSRRHVVVDRWSSESAQGDLVFLGEAPGEQEDQQGIAFVGPSGDELDAFAVESGVSELPCGHIICNVVKCRPPRNKFPGETGSVVGADAAQTCVNLWLDRQLSLLSPKVIVLVGGKALAWTVFRYRRPLPAMKDAIKCWYKSDRYPGVDFVCMYHPAYLLRQRRQDPERAREIEAASIRVMKWAVRLLQGRAPKGVEVTLVKESVAQPKQQTLF